MAKLGAQTLTFKSVMDKQTNRQADKTRNRKHRRAAAKPAACAKPLILQRLRGEIWCTISDVEKRDGQTDKQTEKKLNVFGRPGGGLNPSPIKLGMAIEDLQRVLARRKILEL